jgi:ATP/maltotriose-dependent transcriptional regulator MalT
MVQSYPLAVRALMQVCAGRLRAAEADAAAALRLSRTSPVGAEDDLALLALSQSQYLLGRWDDAMITANRAIAIAFAEKKAWSYPLSHELASFVRAGRGDWAEAEAAVREALHSRSEIGAESCARAGAVLAQARADHAGMLAALRPILDLPNPRRGWPLIRQAFWRPLLAEALIGTGRLAEAAAEVADLDDIAQQTPYLGVVTARLSGWLAEQRGDPRAAAARYEAGLAAPVSPDDAPLYRGLLEQAYGRLLAAIGERATAVTSLQTARQRFITLTARPFVDRCEADLFTIGQAAAPPVPAAAEFRLTEREREIAYLIGRGRTNREIAAELFLSEKTVEYHLSHVFTKLGMTNRRQVRDHMQRTNPVTQAAR